MGRGLCMGAAVEIARSCVVVGVNHGEIVCGGSDGVRAAVEIGMGHDEVVRGGRHESWRGHAWWFRCGSNGDCCCELWLIG